MVSCAAAAWVNAAPTVAVAAAGVPGARAAGFAGSGVLVGDATLTGGVGEGGKVDDAVGKMAPSVAVNA